MPDFASNPALGFRPPEQVNPLAMAGQYAQTANSMLGLQQNAQTMAARQAIGPIIQQSIDPATGLQDTNRLLSLAAQDPRTAWMAGELASQAVARQKAQLEASGMSLDQALKVNDYMNQGLGAALSQPNFSADTLRNFAIEAATVGPGADNPNVRERILKEMSKIPDDPEGARRFAIQHVIQGLQAQQQLNFTQGQVIPNESGDRTNYLQIPQNPGAPAMLRAFVPRTLTPAEKSEIQTVKNPDGSESQYYRGHLVDPQGNPIPQGSGDGRYPAAPLGQTQTPAAARGAEVAGAGSGQQWTAAQADAAGYSDRQFALHKALDALQSAPTGPGTDQTNYYKSLAISMAPDIAKMVGVDPSKVASYDEANKYLTQYAQKQASGMGAGTDSKLASALSANASTHISNLAAQDVVKANIALEANRFAMLNAFNSLPKNQGGAENFSKFATQWNRDVDPRVFAWNDMTPEQRTKALAGMPNDDVRNRFKQTYNFAVQSGWVEDPRQGGGGPSAQAAPPGNSPVMVPRGY